VGTEPTPVATARRAHEGRSAEPSVRLDVFLMLAERFFAVSLCAHT
jgi:hypothetical protein